MNYFKSKDDALSATFTFDNFSQALEFVNQVGDLAEKNNHHPNILLHDYKQVTVTTTTHDQGNQITNKDRDLAEAIEALKGKN